MPELGNKFECFSCGAKFYDLGKPEPVCPKCGANQKEATFKEGSPEAAAARRRRRDEIARRSEADAETGTDEALEVAEEPEVEGEVVAEVGEEEEEVEADADHDY
jgi:uncharacterized protein (TIGR02300 family)